MLNDMPSSGLFSQYVELRSCRQTALLSQAERDSLMLTAFNNRLHCSVS